jgi:hypothetical protein
MAILAIPAALVVAGLVVHSWKTRGARDTAFFFSFALLFGILRGNTIWWITTVHFPGDFPYIFKNKLIGVFHDSLVADMGWILCLYVGSYLSLCVLERIPALQGRLFPMVTLACLFNATLSYAVESTAIEMGWWGWNLGVHSEVLRDVPMAGIIAWFSVGFDFLVPYLLVRHYRRPGEWWPWLALLIFPLHMLTHLSNTRVSDVLPIVPYNIWHWGMVLATMFLPFAVKLRLRRPWLDAAYLPGAPPSAPAGQNAPAVGIFVRNLPMIGIGVVLSVLFVSDLLIVRSPELAATKAALVYFVLLAIPQIPAWSVLGVAVLAAIMGGQLFHAPLVVPITYYAFRGVAIWPRVPLLKWAYVLVPLALTWSYYDWSMQKHARDQLYLSTTFQGVELVKQGNVDAGIAMFNDAIAIKPYSLRAYEGLSMTYVQLKRYDDALAAMSRVAELRPVSPLIQENIGGIHMLRGDLDAAERAFLRAIELKTKDDYARQMLQEIARLRRAGSPPPSQQDAPGAPEQ